MDRLSVFSFTHLLFTSCTTLAQVADPNVADSVPGVVIAHSPASSGKYIGSAGLAILHNGTYLAKHDEFGPNSTEHTSAITRVYRSTDKGESWQEIAVVDGLFWSSIFEHHGAVYMIGTHHHHGHLLIYKSIDQGKTWTSPNDRETGLIRPGKFHTAPVPVLAHDGRLWRAVEDADGPEGWGKMYRPRVMSIPLDGDLLDANQWTITNPIERDGGWLGGDFWCVLEGNVVVDRDRVVRNILRSNHDDTAAVTTVSSDGKVQSIDPDLDRIPLPGSSKKVEIRWDKSSGLYWALSNLPHASNNKKPEATARNTLAIFSSPNLRTWTLRSILLHHPDSKYHAFQYPDWLIEGDDLLVASRTAFDDGCGGAHSAHDANFLTFHRFPNFRRMTMAADGIQIK